MAADARRLAELSMPTELAKEVASQIESAPTTTTRGGVLQQPSSGVATVADVVTALIAAGLMAP